ATSMTTPRRYSLRDGVSFTGLPCPSVTVRPPVPTLSARPPFVEPWPERAAVPRPAGLNLPPRRCRKRDRYSQRKAAVRERAPAEPQAHSECPSHRHRKAWDAPPWRL